MKHFTLFVSALIGGMFLTTSVSAQQKEYTDGVFMLNEGSFGKEKATLNYLDKAGKWEYRVALTKNSETYELGTTLLRHHRRRQDVHRVEEEERCRQGG